MLVLGASMLTTISLFTAFMGGLAFGACFFGRRTGGYKNPLLVFAGLAFGIAIYACLTPFLFSTLVPIYQGLAGFFDAGFVTLNLLRFLLAVLMLLLPTALMGGSFPVVAQVFKNRVDVGKRIALLYAFNFSGAAVAVLALGFYLLPGLGLQKSTFIAAGLSALIALLAYFLSKKVAGTEVLSLPENKESVASKADKKAGKLKQAAQALLAKVEARKRTILLSVFAISGFCATIYLVVWTRILNGVLAATLETNATILATALLGLAIGSFVFSLFLKHFKKPLWLFALLQAGIAFSAFAGEFVVPLLPGLSAKLLTVFQITGVSELILSAALIFVPTMLMGGIFPLLIHLLTSKNEDHQQSPGAIVGRAVEFNLFGMIVGAVTVIFFLLPNFGLQFSLHIAMTINALLCLILIFFVSDETSEIQAAATNKEAPVWATGGIFAFLVIMAAASPPWHLPMMSSDASGQNAAHKHLYYEEGLSAAVTVVQHQTLSKEAHLTLLIDGQVQDSTGSEMKMQRLVAHLPMLLVPQPAQDVMLIGHGSGMIAGAMAAHPVSKLTIFEMAPAVIAASVYFDAFSNKILDDPRVRLVEDDARNILMLQDDLYDVIVSKPSRFGGSESAQLFTQEFFSLAKTHLDRGGIYAQWLPFDGMASADLKSLIKTFHSAFPFVMIFQADADTLILLGSEDAFEVDRETITARMKDPAVAKDLARAEVHSVFDLWTHLLLGPGEIERYVGDAALNTDDLRRVSLQNPPSSSEQASSIQITEMKGAAIMGGNYLFAVDAPNSLRAKGYYAMAKGYLRHNKARQASEMLQRGERLNKSAEGEMLWGRALLSEGDRTGAKKAWQDALEIEATHQESLLLLAKLYQSQGAFKKASPLLEQIKKRGRLHLRASYYKGLDYYFRGKPLSAIEALLVGERFSEPFVYYYQNLVYQQLGLEKDAKLALGHFIEGLNAWRRTLETRPKEFKALPYWRDVMWRRKVGVQIPEEERMAMLFERVVLNPLNELHSGTGIFLAGYYPEAAQKLEAALKQLGPRAKGSIGYYYLGLSYKKVGRFVEAANAFRDFISDPALAPDDLRVLEAKKEIEALET